MRRIFAIASLILTLSSTAFAGCVEHAVLREEPGASKFKWSNAGGRIPIKVWDSPGLVTIVGHLTPGSYVRVFERGHGFIKVKAPEDQGGAIGWVSVTQVEMTLAIPETKTDACDPAHPGDDDGKVRSVPVLSTKTETETVVK